MTADYSEQSLVQALEALGVRKGDIVLSHVSLGRLGYAEEGRTMADASRALLGALRSVVGDKGTLLIPTYTYSLGKGEVFDVQATPSTVGEFTEIFRKRPGVSRSAEPMLATAGEGPAARGLLKDIAPTSFGPGSVFERLRLSGGKICCFGLGLHWATYRHHIEEAAGVPFRFHKKFLGKIRDEGREYERSWDYFCAPRLDECEADGRRLEDFCLRAGVARRASVGRSEAVRVDAQAYFDFGLARLKEDPWLSAKGPPRDIPESAKV